MSNAFHHCVSLQFFIRRGKQNNYFLQLLHVLAIFTLLMHILSLRRLSQALAVSLHAAVTSPPPAPISAMETSLL